MYVNLHTMMAIGNAELPTTTEWNAGGCAHACPLTGVVLSACSPSV